MPHLDYEPPDPARAAWRRKRRADYLGAAAIAGMLLAGLAWVSVSWWLRTGRWW